MNPLRRFFHRAALPTVLGIGILVGALALGAPATANAQTTAAPEMNEAPQGPPISGTELDHATEETASRLRCPVCQGLSVADSPASSAVDLKAEVRRLLALGYTRDQVIASFERSYGEFIRLEPKAEGFNWLVWLMPMLALAIGALVIFFRLRPARPASQTAPTQEETPSS